jgi:signal transduction histidine kinase/ligand-binding sensor domain-containing protein/CheY-like chemotaxis protein/AraC-like DNA-binding protein
MKAKIFLILFFLTSQFGFGQQKVYNFTNYNSKDGLASNTINAVLKDKYGFMWFATEDGLNKFDGQNFNIYRHKEGDPNSLGRGSVMALKEDKNGNLWVGTGDKLSLYNRGLNNFKNYDFNNYGWVRSLEADHLGNIWVGTYTGLYYFDPKTNKRISYRANPTDPNKLNSDIVLCIFEDSKKRVWVGTTNGLHLFNKKTGAFKRLLQNPSNPKTVSNNGIRTITEDRQGNLWFGTDEAGIIQLNPKTGNFSFLKNQANNPNSISNNRVFKIAFDKDQKLWIGTENGLNIYDPVSQHVTRIKRATKNPNSLTNGIVGFTIRDLYIDNGGIFWFGTHQNGINKYDSNLAFFNYKQHNPLDKTGLSGSSITSFKERPNGEIYVGIFGGGLNVFNPKTEVFRKVAVSNSKGSVAVFSALEMTDNTLWAGTYEDGLYEINGAERVVGKIEIPKTEAAKANPAINCLKADQKGNIWIGTNGGGVFLYNIQTKTLKRLSESFPQISKLINGYITDIEIDRNGRFWLGSNGSGVAILDTATGKIEVRNNSNSKLPMDKALDIYCSKSGQTWVGVLGGGLCLYNYKNQTFSQFGENQNLANDVIYQILEDRNQKLWVSTNKGISSFDIKNQIFKNYNHHNGVQQSSFNAGAGLASSDGVLYFGGLEGFNYFKPESLFQNKNTPTLIITDLKIGNKSINPEDDSEIKDHISVAKEITLNYKQNFSLDFVALNYTAPEETQYSYKLDGFEKEWNHVGSKHTAVYTNLDPGTYTFRLKAKSEDGAWQTPEKLIEITVEPPFYRTYLAYFLYLLTFAFIFYTIRRRGIEKLRNEFALKQERLEVKHLIASERKEAEQKMELEKLKVKFLTNLSHELKTPLTLVLNPSESLINQEQSTEKLEMLNIINRNAKRLLNLVNQLLDFRKIEDHELNLNLTDGDLIQFTKEIFDSFKYISDRKNIHLDFESSISEYYTAFDKDKIERILVNLLANAIKFTHENGNVSLQIKPKSAKGGIVIAIEDTGIGIPADKVDQIFERFVQLNDDEQMLNQGSGIGLSIIQEFVKLHGGTISVTSKVGLGSTFSVHLPLAEKPMQSKTALPEIEKPKKSKTVSVETDEQSAFEKPVLLLVDDNDDLRRYLTENLKEKYKIIEAEDGKKGWQKALSHHPDIIVSDVNMPNMDGITLLNKIKNDPRTKHIPIILLTVMSEESDEIKGLEMGANDYLTKPFSFQVLNLKIANLLNLNLGLKNTYSKQIKIETPLQELVSEDEKLLLKVSQYVDENIGNAEISIEDISKKMFMSRGTLYNKILSLTGETPVEYIRSMKLKKAAVLLEKSDMKISQIGYEVGFSNPNYFARAFKAKYDMTPSEFAKQKRGE